MDEHDLDRIAAGLEKAISSIDDEINKLKKKELNSELHAIMMLARGRAMRNLSEISSNKEELLGYAIGSLTNSVNMFNKLRIDHESARAHYELALSYVSLSRVKDMDRNHDIAIRALDEAKESITYDDDPMLYGKIEQKLKELWKQG